MSKKNKPGAEEVGQVLPYKFQMEEESGQEYNAEDIPQYSAS